MDKIKDLLDDVIKKEIQDLKFTSSGDEKRSEAIKDLTALHKLRIEEIKAQTEAEEKRERRIMDSEQHKADLALKEREANGRDADRAREDVAQKAQVREQSIDRYVRIGVAAAELVLPLMFYGVWMKRGFKFEESGTFTSSTFKNLFNRFKPTKRG